MLVELASVNILFFPVCKYVHGFLGPQNLRAILQTSLLEEKHFKKQFLHPCDKVLTPYGLQMR